MTSSQKYLLTSNIDGGIFEINEKVVNSSVLLKNIFELTKVTPTIPVGIDCRSNYLCKFIEIIQILGDEKEDLNSKIIQLFKDFNDDLLNEFVKGTCILDSDILLNVVADVILDKIKDFTREEINEYLEIEDDFSHAEREWQNQNMLEYFISLKDPSFILQFPLPCSQSFYSMKTKFSSPFNALLSRICQRSNDSLAFRLSLCSKLLKNECDRSPIKLSRFYMQFFCWCLEIESENLEWIISLKNKNDKYFSAICKRRVMIWNDNIILNYGHASFLKDQFDVFTKFSFSLDWMIPHNNSIKKIEVNFSNFEIFVSSFVPTKFHFPNVFFGFYFRDGIDFDFIYNHFIANDLSKDIKLRFKFSKHLSIHLSKKSHTSQFFKCYCTFQKPMEPLPSKFKPFLMNYLEYDGRVEFIDPHSIIPAQVVHINSETPFLKYCFVYDLLKYL